MAESFYVRWPSAAGGSGSGTVTSVGLSLPSFITVSGSPVTSSGTLTGTLATQSANTVFAGPGSGAAAQPTFRSLVSADISSLFGNLTDVGTDGIIITGGSGVIFGAGTSIAQHVADTTHNGYLSSTDWNTFNGKQASGNYITALTGDITASGPGSVAATLAAITNSTLTTLSALSLPSTQLSGTLPAARLPAFTGDVTTSAGSSTTSLVATTNSTLTTLSALISVGTLTTGTWNATTIAVAHGGTGVTSVTTAPAASSFAGWDANKNLSANNLIEGYTTTVSSATPIALTVASTYQQFITGSTAQAITMPVASTLVLGQSWQIFNLSTNTTTVETSAGTTIQALVQNEVLTLTCILTSGTTTASWSWQWDMIQSAAIPVLMGGTGVTTATAHGVVVANSTTAYTTTAVGSVNQVFTQATAAANPVWSNPATGSYSQAFHTSAATWATTSSTYADPTASGTPALTVRKSSGITLTTAATSLAGITFTPANNTAVYLITASISCLTSLASTIGSQLFDGTTVIAQGADSVTFGAGQQNSISITGVYAPATASAVTVKIQISNGNPSATTTIQQGSHGNPIEWTVLRIF